MKEPKTQVETKAPEYPIMPPTFARGIDNYDVRLAYWHRHCDNVKAAEQKSDRDIQAHSQFLNKQIAGFWNDCSEDAEQNQFVYDHYNKIWKQYAAKCRITSKKIKVDINAFAYYVGKALKVRRILELDPSLTFEVVDKWNDKTIDTWLRTHDNAAPSI